MSESAYPRFLRWGEFTSRDEKNPDILEWEVIETDTFETEYGICVNAEINNEIRAVPLHNFSSANKSLLNLWNDAIKKNKIQKYSKFQLHTWLGKSIKNKDRTIRRFKIIF